MLDLDREGLTLLYFFLRSLLMKSGTSLSLGGWRGEEGRDKCE
jgi:hypothetical protein